LRHGRVEPPDGVYVSTTPDGLIKATVTVGGENLEEVCKWIGETATIRALDLGMNGKFGIDEHTLRNAREPQYNHDIIMHMLKTTGPRLTYLRTSMLGELPLDFSVLQLPNIQTLEIDYCRNAGGFHAAASWRLLRHLNADATKLTTSDLALIVLACPRLETLCIPLMGRFGTEEPVHPVLTEALMARIAMHPNLRRLDLSGNKLPNGTLELLAESWVVHLTLCDTDLSNEKIISMLSESTKFRKLERIELPIPLAERMSLRNGALRIQ
jgi:hypothetical protein